MATKKRTTKKVTYGEFLAWLEGVESMQEENWTPTAIQWKTIREKLNTVKPDVEIREVKTEAPAAPAPFAQPPMTFPPSAFEAPSPRPPMPLSNVPRQPSEHEGVPAATTAPVLNPDGTPAAPGTEFL